MALAKEMVKFLDGTEKEIELGLLVISQLKRLKALYLKVHKIVPEVGPDGKQTIKAMEGTFDYETLSLEIVKGAIKPLNIDLLMPGEEDRIYNKHYAKYVNPGNSEEEKKSLQS